MQRAEGTGRTLEEAQQNALEQLGVPAEQVTFEVLERSGTLGGIFGRGAYRVLATVETPEDTDEETREHDETMIQQPPESAESESVEEEPADSDAPHYRVATAGRDLLQRMVDLMGIDGEVQIASCTEEEVLLNVEGEDMGLLIGRHGATLDAIQLVVAIGANRGVQDGARVIVDAEGYRARHQEMIVSRARKLAADAVEHGREVVVPDLKPYERRLMHVALKDDPSVETYSEGDGDDRVLVISPV